MRYFMGTDSNPNLGAIQLNIVSVRSGSIIIETQLTATESLLNAAKSNVESNIGSSYIDDGERSWDLLDFVDLGITIKTTPKPTSSPTPKPTESPSMAPTFLPSPIPTAKPIEPTMSPLMTTENLESTLDFSVNAADDTLTAASTAFGDLILPVILVVLVG